MLIQKLYKIYSCIEKNTESNLKEENNYNKKQLFHNLLKN
jgi:hypothetical protein